MQIMGSIKSWPSSGLFLPFYELLKWGVLEKPTFKEGCWEYYSKYIEKNRLSYFLSMQCINRCLLAMVASSKWQ